MWGTWQELKFKCAAGLKLPYPCRHSTKMGCFMRQAINLTLPKQMKAYGDGPLTPSELSVSTTRHERWASPERELGGLDQHNEVTRPSPTNSSMKPETRPVSDPSHKSRCICMAPHLARAWHKAVGRSRARVKAQVRGGYKNTLAPSAYREERVPRELGNNLTLQEQVKAWLWRPPEARSCRSQQPHTNVRFPHHPCLAALADVRKTRNQDHMNRSVFDLICEARSRIRRLGPFFRPSVGYSEETDDSVILPLVSIWQSYCIF